MTETLLLQPYRRGIRVGSRLLVIGDPKDAGWMRSYLVDAIARHGYDQDHLPEFTMEIRPLTDPSHLYGTFAATARP